MGNTTTLSLSSKPYLTTISQNHEKNPSVLSVLGKRRDFLSADFKNKDAGFAGLRAGSAAGGAGGQDERGPKDGTQGRGEGGGR